MSSAVLNFVIFAVLCRKILMHPANESASTISPSTENISDDVIEMGKGLKTIPAGRWQTTTLNLAFNHISSLPESIFRNNSYKSLTRIELSHNRINTIHPSALRGLRQLTTIDLSNNNLTSIDPYMFKYNIKLEKVDLSGNRINFDRLQVFLISQTIETLVLTGNRIEKVFELNLIGLPSLRNLILDHNSLSLIAPNSFKTLNKLQYLSIANTGVCHLTESMFNVNLPRIIDLQDTCLAKKFSPSLTKITNMAVKSLLTFNPYIYPDNVPI